MNSSLSYTDASFGPVVKGCDRTFDFTVTFEESILSIIPSVLLIFVAPIRILLLKGQRRRVGGKAFQRTKLVSLARISFDIIAYSSPVAVRDWPICGAAAGIVTATVSEKRTTNTACNLGGCPFVRRCLHILYALLH